MNSPNVSQSLYLAQTLIRLNLLSLDVGFSVFFFFYSFYLLCRSILWVEILLFSPSYFIVQECYWLSFSLFLFDAGFNFNCNSHLCQKFFSYFMDYYCLSKGSFFLFLFIYFFLSLLSFSFLFIGVIVLFFLSLSLFISYVLSL